MSRRTILLVVFAFSFGLTATGQVSDESSVPRISVADLKKAAAAGQVLIVDVRDARSYADGHIPGAINVPLAELQARAAALRRAKQGIVTYCS